MDATRKALTLVEEFRTFAFKANVIELAVGVIIGGAFGKIVDSLVKPIILPSISGLLPGQQGYLGGKLTLAGKDLPYGLFIGEVVNLLLVALAIFLSILKFLGWIMHAKQEEAAAPPPPLTRDQALLIETRDLLKRDRSAAT